jgi:Xaa-Pro aminopeptidase
MTASEKLVQKLGLGACDAVAVHNPSNMFYLTEGYTGEGVVYISAKQKVIITDFRYTEQAERQAPKFKVVMVGNGLNHSAWVAKLCEEDGITTLRYEDDYLTVKDFEALHAAVGDKTYLPLNGAPEVLRQVKTDAEVACIRKACDITSKAFEEVVGRIHEGMTEKELRIELDFIQLKMGAQGNSFDTIIASGVNGSLCHAVPTDKKLVKGEMITMDFGCKVGGYCSDMTRTVALGEPTPEMRRIYDTVLHAQEICEDAVAPGKNCFDIDKMARDYIDAQGYAGRFGHGLGHAVGIDIHENPRFSTACHDTLVPGIVITVEPGVYVPGLGGVRIENTVLVTETGHEALTTARKELIIL